MTVGELPLTEHDSGWDLPLVGREVDQIWFDFAVTLVVDGSETVRLATRFTVDVEGVAHLVDLDDPQSVLPVLGLHRALVLAARADRSGALQLRFDGNRLLHVAPDDEEEAWEVAGGLPPATPAYAIRALPGGGVSVR